MSFFSLDASFLQTNLKIPQHRRGKAFKPAHYILVPEEGRKEE
jgi:hypothetical protein